MLNFQDEGHLDANFLIFVLTIIVNAYFFSSLVAEYVCIFPSSQGLQWTHKSPKKQSYFAKKMFFLKLIFQDEGPSYANCLFYFLVV